MAQGNDYNKGAEPGLYKQTTIIRVNAGMIRDAWTEEDSDGNHVLVIRQTKFGGDGTAAVKEIRLVGKEIDILRSVMDSILG